MIVLFVRLGFATWVQSVCGVSWRAYWCAILKQKVISHPCEESEVCVLFTQMDPSSVLFGGSHRSENSRTSELSCLN